MFGYRVSKQQLLDGFKVNDAITDFILLKDCHIDDETAKIVSNGINVAIHHVLHLMDAHLASIVVR